ncbi:hypothetical protein BD413DRAFT_314064 [Trametes elegans]|nr:hypothetical protein BD413DRAFT_314064 [Trametes elegans]
MAHPKHIAESGIAPLLITVSPRILSTYRRPLRRRRSVLLPGPRVHFRSVSSFFLIPLNQARDSGEKVIMTNRMYASHLIVTQHLCLPMVHPATAETRESLNRAIRLLVRRSSDRLLGRQRGPQASAAPSPRRTRMHRRRLAHQPRLWHPDPPNAPPTATCGASPPTPTLRDARR